MQLFSDFATSRPKTVMRVSAFVSVLLIALVAVPSLMPSSVPFLNGVTIDTDPENMLPADEPVRVYHNDQKKNFALHDMVVVGVVDNESPQGVFTVETLKEIYALTNYAKSLRWQDDKGIWHGVIEKDLMSPSTVDNIEQAGLGSVSFNWLMQAPPETQEQAAQIAKAALNLPLLNGTLISEDGKAAALYIPIELKADGYDVARQLKAEFETFEGSATYYVTGMPVAQDQFGVEMFVQMAISAPAAMVLIFLLMWFFFRQINLIIAPMLVAMVSVVVTMGLLIATGNTVHIMSSMIPIFIMPIAVLDSVHILSDFFDRYKETGDRKATLKAVMSELSAPMFFTSLTTFAGFVSLTLTPIPPVQVFGFFVALGVMAAWAFTITMIPAYIMLMPEKSFANFGMEKNHEDHGPLGNALQAVGRFTFNHAKLVILATAAFGVIAYIGIQKITINDNPVKWFAPSHDIRVADRALNERFAGTYMAYLVMEADESAHSDASQIAGLKLALEQSDLEVAPELIAEIEELDAKSMSFAAILSTITSSSEERLDVAGDDEWMAWDDALIFLGGFEGRDAIFKDPKVLNFVSELEDYLLKTGLVGKSSSVVDVVKTVHRELYEGAPEAYRIPVTRDAVAQTLLTFQNSHRPDDLWHFVTPDYKSANLWIQLKSGDNKDMSALVEAIEEFFAAHEAPTALTHNWFGLTYINVVWQQQMVSGMMEAFLGSFIVVLILMIVLFRSVLWGTLAMVPLTVTIAMIYGLIGLIGKDYDMPVAVLSSLSLGLAVDYAIHFLARSRYLRTHQSSWQETVPEVFGEPARAITRNVIVLGVGFLPLLAAPLVPYNTVGIFISAILLLAGFASIFILPALIKLMQSWLFRGETPKSANTLVKE
ncbi:MAG: RND transporter [Alphaproteobacteria bacterium]|nr:MAG: RND transporter [Alphaproteobacteria bacterium]